MKFKGDIVITDPCYVVNDEDWEFSEYGDRMDKLGFTKKSSRKPPTSVVGMKA